MATDTSLEDGTNILKHIVMNLRILVGQVTFSVSYLNLMKIYLLTNKM
jgi:hypothetical protein